MDSNTVLLRLKEMADPSGLEALSRYGIDVERAWGVSLPKMQALAKQIGRKDHQLALDLWASGVHEARILACMVDETGQLTGDRMDAMILDFHSWDLCDQCCSVLFSYSQLAWGKALEWSGRQGEFEKRASFALMAALVVHDKQAKDEDFLPFLKIIERESADDRNYVRKAVNWALRQIGKRDLNLNRLAVETAERIKAKGDRSSRWIASDALRELRGENVQERLKKRERR
jgi:3-methyladenine DNA glycosylase AlkD